MIYNDTVAYPWFAPAGQRRGIIDNATNIGYIDPTTGEFVADKNNVGLRDMEYRNFINPITSFTNIGLLNYGNKNSFDSSSALDRTNVARLVNYLRDRLAKAVSPFLFEPNDNLTRTQVRAICQTLLADILAKRGLYDYLVVCDTSNNTPARIDRNELWIDIAIEPVKAVEFIYIPIRILNTGEIAGLVTNG
jgi:phage tail sheath protein FI